MWCTPWRDIAFLSIPRKVGIFSIIVPWLKDIYRMVFQWKVATKLIDTKRETQSNIRIHKLQKNHLPLFLLFYDFGQFYFVRRSLAFYFLWESLSALLQNPGWFFYRRAIAMLFCYNCIQQFCLQRTEKQFLEGCQRWWSHVKTPSLYWLQQKGIERLTI